MNTRRERRAARLIKNYRKRLKRKLLRELGELWKEGRLSGHLNCRCMPDPNAVQIETIGGNRL